MIERERLWAGLWADWVFVARGPPSCRCLEWIADRLEGDRFIPSGLIFVNPLPPNRSPLVNKRERRTQNGFSRFLDFGP